MVIASIVEEETENKAEKPDVASVYYNRVKNDWPLEADPTLKFALGDFSLKRIYGVYTKIESPFNTYKYPGLPPGPICTPSTTTIDAVLNLRPSKNMFFCAKPDFSGTHQFAVTLKEHNQNSARYHAFLNQQGIR